ncbi:biopolymer transporter ExbD [Candidatus Schneideria nysicola]|uniref:biopolymer transporter ExbD n=1 Tax=Candidatus Schneideria nysicola TaxID=1081631 RepID=UPI001CAA4D11|nr:biopolymer transporter ExbD [Candidatus Schneideria nysicola]UAJ65615.1 biopolymer transporter ExbD [Candidatus Schneideria nysicola]
MIKRVNHNVVKRDIKDEINMVPFLDILLVIMLLFMLTAVPFFQKFDVNLPHSTVHSESIVSKNNVIIIEVYKPNFYNISVNQKKIKGLNTASMKQEIYNRMKDDANLCCILGGEKDIPYREIIVVLNILKTIGVQSVGLLTKHTN